METEKEFIFINAYSDQYIQIIDIDYIQRNVRHHCI